MGWFIKLYIKLLEWRWSDDPNMVSTLVHVFMLANTEDRDWHGDIIPRGSFVTTRSKLAKLVGISEQQMRTCLKRLVDEDTIELNCTNKYTIVTVCNYAIYQDNKNDVNQQITNKQPTNNQQITSNNNIEYKSNRDKENISKDISKKVGGPCRRPGSLEEVIAYCQERNSIVDPEEFWDKNNSVGWVDKNGNPYKDWKAALRTWERFRKKAAATNAANEYKEEELWH